MNELNEIIEHLMLDIGLEGIGTAAGIGLMWGLMFGGSFFLFHSLLGLLVASV